MAAWLPTALLTAPATLVTGATPDYHPKAVAVSVAATVALLTVVARRARSREL